MAPKRFLLKRSTSPSPESTYCPRSQPITGLLLAPRSTSLSPSMVGGLVAIGILALLSAVGMGFAIHVQYCRRSDCTACGVIVCLTRPRGSHSVPVHDHGNPPQQTQQHACTGAPRSGLFLFRPFTQSSRMSSRRSLPSLTPPPTHNICRPQNLEKEIPNPVASIRGSVPPSVVSSSCIPALEMCGIVPPRPPPKDPLIFLEGKIIRSGGTWDRTSNLSEDISMITLPSFVEHEHHDPTFATIPSPSSPPTPSYSERNLTDDPPCPPMSVLHRQPYVPYRALSLLPRRTGSRNELATAKLKLVVQGEAVKNRKPESLNSDSLSPLGVATHALPLSVDDQHRSRGSRGSPQLSPSPNSSPSPILGFPNSPASYSAPGERCSHIALQAGSSVLMVPFPSVFPPPPHFPLGPRDKELSVISGYSKSGRTFSSAMLWKGNSVRGIETTLPDERQAPTPRLGAGTLRSASTITPCPVPGRHPRPESIGRGGTLVRLRDSSRVPSMRRLSRIPLGPRQMLDRSGSQRRRAPQPLLL